MTKNTFKPHFKRMLLGTFASLLFGIAMNILFLVQKNPIKVWPMIPFILCAASIVGYLIIYDPSYVESTNKEDAPDAEFRGGETSFEN